MTTRAVGIYPPPSNSHLFQWPSGLCSRGHFSTFTGWGVDPRYTSTKKIKHGIFSGIRYPYIAIHFLDESLVSWWKLSSVDWSTAQELGVKGYSRFPGAQSNQYNHDGLIVFVSPANIEPCWPWNHFLRFPGIQAKVYQLDYCGKLHFLTVPSLDFQGNLPQSIIPFSKWLYINPHFFQPWRLAIGKGVLFNLRGRSADHHGYAPLDWDDPPSFWAWKKPQQWRPAGGVATLPVATRVERLDLGGRMKQVTFQQMTNQRTIFVPTWFVRQCLIYPCCFNE